MKCSLAGVVLELLGSVQEPDDGWGKVVDPELRGMGSGFCISCMMVVLRRGPYANGGVP